jgi:hypothetical protein
MKIWGWNWIGGAVVQKMQIQINSISVEGKIIYSMKFVCLLGIKCGKNINSESLNVIPL